MPLPVAFIDFETKPIEPRPAYPPTPVGVAILEPGKRRGEYLAWGHPDGNNTTKAAARKRLLGLWRGGRVRLAFHNAAFDLEVAEQALDLPLPPVELVECTQVGAFLYDPNRLRIDLKELAEDLCGLKPDARDALRKWITENVPEARFAKSKWGAHIWRAPGTMVAPYAIDDVGMTRAIFAPIAARIAEHGMGERYRRKLRAMYLLMRMGREGVPADVRKLESEVKRGEKLVEVVDGWLADHLRCPDLNVSSGEELADAIEKRGFVDEWILTGKSEKRSVAIDALAEVLKDRDTYEVLSYRSKLVNAVGTFAKPWLDMIGSGDRIFTIWNQTKQSREGKKIGARTGRYSSTPNFQNVPKKPSPVVWELADYERFKTQGDDPHLLPKSLVERVAKVLKKPCVDLINLRDIIIAAVGQVIGVRDYSQQELRILAHYEAGKLLEAYLKNPNLDLHEHARQLINRMLGTHYQRKPIKNTGFAIIYGQSIDSLSKSIGEDWKTGRTLRRTYTSLFPGLKDLEDELKARASRNEPIKTWGGRVYWVEEPRYSEKFGRVMSFEYKMLNTLIQGSAADCTEEAMIRYDDIKKDGRLHLQVHDELVAGMEKKAARSEMKLLREAMESVEFDLPMLSDGKVGPSWARAKDFNDQREAA